jgi:hypothetical protein
VTVEWVDGLPRIRGPIPMDDEVVLAEVPIENV